MAKSQFRTQYDKGDFNDDITTGQKSIVDKTGEVSIKEIIGRARRNERLNVKTNIAGFDIPAGEFTEADNLEHLSKADVTKSKEFDLADAVSVAEGLTLKLKAQRDAVRENAKKKAEEMKKKAEEAKKGEK